MAARKGVMSVDEKRLQTLEAKVEKLDRLVYRLFKLVKPLSNILKEAKAEPTS